MRSPVRLALAVRPRGLRRSSSLLAAMLAALFLVPSLAPRVAAVKAPVKVAIIVGPVGASLTPQYIALAEMAAAAAESRGAAVARAYSPDATPERVIAAVEGAGIVIYFGHGTGYPNPYSPTLRPQVVNGWGLQGPRAAGNHSDNLAAGRLRYYGEAWLEANLHPAPGFVMIYSNACYAPGASEGGLPKPTEQEALAHVANYSRPVLAMGASAYFATDFYGGAAALVNRLLAPGVHTNAQIFSGDAFFDASALKALTHPSIPGAQVWLHRSPYFGGQMDYWYAFAGQPDRFAGSGEGGVLAGHGAGPAAAFAPPVTGRASSYPFTTGLEDVATVGLPIALGGRDRLKIDADAYVAICADRCALLPVVDSCPCYWGTADQRVANLSHTAWRLISDMPLEEGLIDVRIYLDGKLPRGERQAPVVMHTAADGPPIEGVEPASPPRAVLRPALVGR